MHAVPAADSAEHAEITHPPSLRTPRAFQDLPARCHPGWVYSVLEKGVGLDNK